MPSSRRLTVFLAIFWTLDRVAGSPDGPALHAGRCILCNALGASKAPRICNSCDAKY